MKPRQQVRYSVLLTGCAVAMALSQPAWAQQPADADRETGADILNTNNPQAGADQSPTQRATAGGSIVVTGSRIARQDFEANIMGSDFADGRGNVSLALSLNTREANFQRDREWYRDLWTDPNAPGASLRLDHPGIAFPASNPLTGYWRHTPGAAVAAPALGRGFCRAADAEQHHWCASLQHLQHQRQLQRG